VKELESWFNWPNEIPGLENAFLLHCLRNRLADTHDMAMLSFLRLLSLTRHYEVTESKDRIYGLLGLARSIARKSAPWEGLQPSYSKPLAEIYAETAEQVIWSLQNLYLLSCVQHEEQSPELSSTPTWIPK